jgi:hypothetical protein
MRQNEKIKWLHSCEARTHIDAAAKQLLEYLAAEEFHAHGGLRAVEERKCEFV